MSEMNTQEIDQKNCEVQNEENAVETVDVEENATEDGETPEKIEESSEERAEVIEPEIVTDEEKEAEVQEALEASSEPKKDETDWKDAYIRLAADFDNYRKRTSKEQEEIRRRERERVIRAWLEVYDNTERAIAALPEKEGTWFEGFNSLIQQMNKCLATFKIQPVDDMGKTFDPKRHEAIQTIPCPNMENGKIIHVENRGFVYENGDVARIARVIVVKNPS